MGKSSAPDEVTQKTEPWSAAQPYLKEAMGGASSLYKQGGPQYYPGQGYVQNNQLQDLAQGGMLDYAMQQMPGQIWDTQKAQYEMLNAPDVANNQYVQGMMGANADLLNRNLQENLLPSVRGGALATGGVGGSRQGIAEGLAMRGTQDAISNTNANIMGDAYGRGLTSQFQGMTMAPQTMQMGLMPYQQMGAAGDYAYNQDQMALQDSMNRWNAEQGIPYDNASWYSGLLQGYGGMGGTSTGTQPGSTSSPIAGALSGGMLGHSLMAGNPWAIGAGALIGLLGS